MNLDGVILGKIITCINHYLPARVLKIVQKHQFQFLLKLRQPQTEFTVVINLQPQSYSLFTTTQTLDFSGGITTPMLVLMRKHLQRGMLIAAEQYYGDRLGVFTFKITDHLGNVHQHRLILEFFGRFVNLILVDATDKIISSIHTTSFDSNRVIARGLTYPWPELHKPSLLEWSPEQGYAGFSRYMVAELQYRDLASIQNDFLNSTRFYVYPQGIYHVIPLRHLQTEAQEIAYDQYYLQPRVQHQTSPLRRRLESYLQQESTKLEQKISKLQGQLATAEEYRTFITRGEELLTYHYDPSFVGQECFTEEELTTAFTTSQAYFRQARKARRSIPHLQEQITQGQTLYQQYQEYYHQLTFHSEEELIELASLVNMKGYQQVTRKRGKQEPYTTYRRGELTFYVGKNAVQNEYLWRHVARKHYLWFHVAHYTGAHVLVNSDTLEEADLRYAAKLAAYFSAARYSSSIEVYYTLVKHLRKGQGFALGQLTIQEHRSIFIDVDEEEIRTI